MSPFGSVFAWKRTKSVLICNVWSAFLCQAINSFLDQCRFRGIKYLIGLTASSWRQAQQHTEIGRGPQAVGGRRSDERHLHLRRPTLGRHGQQVRSRPQLRLLLISWQRCHSLAKLCMAETSMSSPQGDSGGTSSEAAGEWLWRCQDGYSSAGNAPADQSLRTRSVLPALTAMVTYPCMKSKSKMQPAICGRRCRCPVQHMD